MICRDHTGSSQKGMEDLEQLFLSKVKPYEERIQKLEEAEKAKDLEIITLKHAIENLNRIIDTLNQKTGGEKKGTKGGASGQKGPPSKQTDKNRNDEKENSEKTDKSEKPRNNVLVFSGDPYLT
eukprot:TRINITY_DN2388_c0_g2_i16.p2 TRINITY_DN2388_c0_g2~~TRINITY_DN2388_c0_g2_i16.p2  ORF type:complete len:124 (+),score=11.43 TRINITY_DN2388_c0_g2_i16:417-788(+)